MNLVFACLGDFTVPCVAYIDIVIKLKIESALVAFLISLDRKGNLTSVIVKRSDVCRNLGCTSA